MSSRESPHEPDDTVLLHEATQRQDARPMLSGIPETLLWTLHNRAQEAMRSDALLHDAEAIRRYHSIDYDYVRNFGKPDVSHALRSLMFDEALRPWLAAHPGGTVIELGCGLETQFQRCDDGRVEWWCLDVPETIAIRQRYLPSHQRCRHVARSVMDLAWLDEIEAGPDIFISAQGLLMYFEQAQVQTLLGAIDARWPGAELMFDTIPPWFSRKTMRGFRKTHHYQTPPMPWGISRRNIATVMREWMPHLHSVGLLPYPRFRGALGIVLPVASRLPGLRDFLPSIVRLRLSPR